MRCLVQASCQEARARNENGFCFKFYGKTKEMFCSSRLAKCNPQLKGLVELERRCRDTMQEVRLLSERQEVLKGMVEDKIRLPSRTTEKDYDQIFEEMKLDEKKSREVPLIVQKNHDLWRDENERFFAGRLRRSGLSRRTRKDADTQDLSLLRHACHRRWTVEEMSLDSRERCRTYKR